MRCKKKFFFFNKKKEKKKKKKTTTKSNFDFNFFTFPTGITNLTSPRETLTLNLDCTPADETAIDKF